MSDSTRSKYLVDTAWLAAHLTAPDLVVLDGSWHMPASGRSALAEYRAEHIEGAQFFDIDAFSDETSQLPHMLPTTVKFTSRIRQLGVGDGMRVVVYDTLGLFSAARVWWMFRAMGHEDVAVLDGGLRKWKLEGRPLTSELPAPRFPRHFTARANAMLVRERADIERLLLNPTEQIVDARSAARFSGAQPEPRPGLRSGHIPGSRNVPFETLINPDGTLKAELELAATFAAAGVDLARPVVTSCGSGVTAAVLSLALAVLGRPDGGLYDGAWAEWGQASLATPVATGN